jgi:hypothetical protein
VSIRQHLQHGGLDELRAADVGGPADVQEHLGGGVDQRDGVRQVLPGDVVRGAAHGLEHRHRPGVVGVGVVRAHQPHAARDLRRDVRADVPEHVGGDHDVEPLRLRRDGGQAVVDDQEVRLDPAVSQALTAVVAGDLQERLLEQPARDLEDVRLFQCGDLRPSVPQGRLERGAADELASFGGLVSERLRIVARQPVLDRGVQVLDVLADEQEVRAGHAGRDGVEGHAPPDVRVLLEPLADGHVAARLVAFVERPQRALQDGVCPPGLLQRSPLHVADQLPDGRERGRLEPRQDLLVKVVDVAGRPRLFFGLGLELDRDLARRARPELSGPGGGRVLLQQREEVPRIGVAERALEVRELQAGRREHRLRGFDALGTDALPSDDQDPGTFVRGDRRFRQGPSTGARDAVDARNAKPET